MKYLAHPAGILSREFLHELNRTIDDFYNLSFTEGFPLFPEHGLAVLGDESFSPPLVMCISLPIPRSSDEASRMYWGWMDIERQMRQKLGESLKSDDIKTHFIRDSIKELRENGDQPAYISRLSEFWVTQLNRTGISLRDQVKNNTGDKVIGHFALLKNSNRCLLFSMEMGLRAKELG